MATPARIIHNIMESLNGGKGKIIGMGEGVYDIDAQTLFNRVVAVGEMLSYNNKSNLNTLIKELKIAGLYESQFDAIWATRGYGSESYKLNIINNKKFTNANYTWVQKLVGATVPVLQQIFYSVCE
jgi:hypothetical protein